MEPNNYSLIGGVKVENLIEEYGTPLYVYDFECIAKHYHSLREVLPPNIDIFYSLKANSNLSICTHLHHYGAGAEVSSGGELITALRVGFAPKNISYTSPGKTDEELCLALKNDIYVLNVDSYYELERINRIAAELGKTANVSIRVNPKDVPADVLIPSGGGSQKLGIDEEKLEEVLRFTRSLPNINLGGLHIHSASQINDYKFLVRNAAHIIDLALRHLHPTGRQLRSISFGGGLGIPHKTDNHNLDLAQYGREMDKLLQRKAQEYTINLSAIRFIIEPGRFLVGKAGFYFTRVIDIKVSRGKKYLIVDGGVNHIRKQMIPEEESTAFIMRDYRGQEEERCDVAGPLCLATDIIARDLTVPKNIRIGDIVGITNAGAYCLNTSYLHFLQHPLPAEVATFRGTAYLIRERGKTEDFFQRQKVVLQKSNQAGIFD